VPRVYHAASKPLARQTRLATPAPAVSVILSTLTKHYRARRNARAYVKQRTPGVILRWNIAMLGAAPPSMTCGENGGTTPFHHHATADTERA